jgi:asparagine synthase (glutamine-hydrolysing)
MSGICGICEPGRKVPAERLAAMLEAMALGDESAEAQATSASAVFGVARRWKFQQVASLRGIQVAGDAELLNRDELQKLAMIHIPDPAHATTAELIAGAYLEKGTDFVNFLDGAFSIAIWDEGRRRLLLAIDRLGINSLYWREGQGEITFASRVSAIRADLDDRAEVNASALMQYLLFSAVPAPLTIFDGVQKMRPGHVLIYEGGEVSQRQYWDLEYPEENGRSEVQWASDVRESMQAATLRQLRDLEPRDTGAYLSGGTDSSSVVAFLTEWNAPAKSFSIFFSEDRYSEINYARIAARKFATKHSELCLQPKDAVEALPLLSEYFDEPFANSSAIGGYFCAKLAAENGVNTLLAGDGGDELFGGNERYATDKRFVLYHSIPKPLRRWLIEPAIQFLPANDGKLSLPRRYIRRALIPNPRRIFSYGIFLSTPPEEIFERDFLNAAPPEHWMDVADSHFNKSTGRSELNRLMYLDTKLILADNDLRKVLGTAELAGVRARFPLLDYRLAELSGRIPSRLKVKGFKKRYIFKKAMQGVLPTEILHKQKHGFGVPVALWFLREPRLKALVKDVLNDSKTRQRGYFRPSFFDQVMRLHREEDAKNYGEVIWYLVMLELWHRRHLERRTASAFVH